MKALKLDADWDPRPEVAATLDSTDVANRVARRGNQVWRNPRISVATLPDPSPGPDDVVIAAVAAKIRAAAGSEAVDGLHRTIVPASGYPFRTA